MKNLERYNLKEIKNANEINGGCFSYDLGFTIRALFGGNSPGRVAILAVDYAAHYAGEDVH